jgi:hypothetical protein
LKDLLGKKKNLFQAQTTLLQQLYIKKTEQEGLLFAKKLLAEVFNDMQLLNDEVKHFSDILSNAITTAEKEIGSRCQDERINGDSFKNTVVKYYDTVDVRNFTNRIIRDKQIQSMQSSTVRNVIAALAGSERTFTTINEHITTDALMDAFSINARESAIHAHNELITNKKQRLIGINIVEKLKEQYGSSDKQNELDEFARNVMESSGVFLTFDKSEISRQLKNNDAPQPGKIMMLNSTLISIPESPENKDFVDKLVDAFRRNSDGSKHIYVDTKSQRMNEITVINLTSCFSLRMVNDVKILKQKYDLLLRGNNPDVARLVLHLEGDGSQYPRIVLPNRAEQQEERENFIQQTLPNILLAKALGYILYQDRMDGTGKHAFCILEEDELGLPLPPIVLSEKITLVESVLTEEIADKVNSVVRLKLSGEYLHQDKRKEIQQLLVNDLKNVVLKECNNNPADQVYNKFLTATRSAIAILNN